MILYLDSYANVAGAPNENFSRELLELYGMGVNGGYTQFDVEELARALTGWTVCERKLPAVGDPLAECSERYWEVEGEWDALFRIAELNFQEGLATTLDVSSVQAALSQAKTNYSQALFDYVVSLAELDRAMGIRFLD